MQGGDEQGEAALSGLPLGALAAGACCFCVVISLYLAYGIWAIWTIFDSVPASHSPCAENSNIWYFCLLAVIMMPLIACLLQCVARMNSSLGLAVQLVPATLQLVMAVWGVMLWVNMTEECSSYYDNDWGHLLLLFKINVVLLGIMFVTIIIVIAAGAAALTAALSHGGVSRYENIPDHPEHGNNGGASSLTEEYV